MQIEISQVGNNCGSKKLHGLSADWGFKHLRCVSMEIVVMFDNGRYPIVALLARQQCNTEVNLGIDTCCKFMFFFFKR